MDTFELLEQAEPQYDEKHTPTESEINHYLESYAHPWTESILADIKSHPKHYIDALESVRDEKEKKGDPNPSLRSVVALAINELWGHALEDAAEVQRKKGKIQDYIFLRDMAIGIFETTAIIPLAEKQNLGRADQLITDAVGVNKDKYGMEMAEAISKYRQIRQIAREAGEILNDDESKSGSSLVKAAADSISGKNNRLTQTPVVDPDHTALYLSAGARIAEETYELLLNLGFAINESNN